MIIRCDSSDSFEKRDKTVRLSVNFTMELNRRNTFRGTINRIRNFTLDLPIFEAATIIALKERLESMKTAFGKLENEHLKLVEAAADQAAVDVHNDYYDEVDGIHTATAIRIQERIAHLENEERQNNAAAVQQCQSDTIRIFIQCNQ